MNIFEVLIKRDNMDSNSFDLEALNENRLKYLKNPLMGYLNKNSLTNKRADLVEIFLNLSLSKGYRQTWGWANRIC